MSYLCYTLDEAAQQLGMSETVLFRLSQFLKIPEQSYDDVGYIAFNGDLTFSEDDIAFFKQVKERLLKGETLENIRQRLRHHSHEVFQGTKHGASAHHISPAQAAQTQYQPITPVSAQNVLQQPLQTIESDLPLRQEAEKSFHHYKAKNRAGLNRVFENIASQISRGVDQIKNSSIADMAFAVPKPVGLRNFSDKPPLSPINQAFSSQVKPQDGLPEIAHAADLPKTTQTPAATITSQPDVIEKKPSAKLPTAASNARTAVSSLPIASGQIPSLTPQPQNGTPAGISLNGASSQFALNFPLNPLTTVQPQAAAQPQVVTQAQASQSPEAPKGFQPITSPVTSIPSPNNPSKPKSGGFATVPQALNMPVPSESAAFAMPSGLEPQSIASRQGERSLEKLGESSYVASGISSAPNGIASAPQNRAESLASQLRNGGASPAYLHQDWQEDPWLGMIQSSLSKPRPMNVRLRSAASLIRQKALSQYGQEARETAALER